jgi:hypothetical protein
MNTTLNIFKEADWADLAQCQGAGTEFDWFGRDKDGHLAVLSSAGSGPIPEAIWNHLREYNALVTRIESLPAKGFVQVFQGSGRYEDWQDFAALGFFAFDYHDVHRVQKLGGYDLMARPNILIDCSTLEAELVSWIPVLNVAFNEAIFIPDAAIVGSTYRHA